MTPIHTLVQGKVEDNFYTPDMPLIYTQRRHLLFVYGTLKNGFIRHQLFKMKSPRFVGNAWTVGEYFTMEYTKGQHPFPIILPTHPQGGAMIHGEVYLVKPETIVSCDFYESNGFMYDRVRAKIDITNSENPTSPLSVDCWMYEGNRKYWAEKKTKQTMNKADICTRAKDGKKFYTFMKKYVNGTPNATLRSM